jgi:hypothetical protein
MISFSLVALGRNPVRNRFGPAGQLSFFPHWLRSSPAFPVRAWPAMGEVGPPEPFGQGLPEAEFVTNSRFVVEDFLRFTILSPIFTSLSQA